MHRIYVAGALNGMATDYIKNLHRMIKYANEIRKNGYAVFVPGLDFLQGIISGTWGYNDYFNNSYSWLQVSEAMFVVPGWEKSKGTKREIKKAEAIGIPVFYKLKSLYKYFR